MRSTSGQCTRMRSVYWFAAFKVYDAPATAPCTNGATLTTPVPVAAVAWNPATQFIDSGRVLEYKAATSPVDPGAS